MLKNLFKCLFWQEIKNFNDLPRWVQNRLTNDISSYKLFEKRSLIYQGRHFEYHIVASNFIQGRPQWIWYYKKLRWKWLNK